jgi:PPK2 family polyphosphate:nucleotide phosphotransferase
MAKERAMKRYRIEPGSKVDLGDFDAGETKKAPKGKKETEEVFADLNARLEVLQEKLWANHQHKVLVVLQGMDTSGKDGTISHVFQGVNPQGVQVASFKAPTQEELDRDFLWRIHARVPRRGEIVIFNRSHYEDILAVRVHKLVPDKVWKARYEQINDFERLLAESGTVILKFFLHIDRDEQKKRLQDRLDDPQKRWKFRLGDLEDRALWDDYRKAYEDVLAKTSQDGAPWYVVPANKKWYRNLVVATVLVETLEKLDMKPPEPEEDLSHVVIE